MSNVQPGDLAMFAPNAPENAGRLVRVIHSETSSLYQCFCEGPWWVVEALQHLDKWRGGKQFNGQFPPGSIVRAPDALLRPIRGEDGTDETLTWAGKPKQREEALMPKRQVEHAR